MTNDYLAVFLMAGYGWSPYFHKAVDDVKHQLDTKCGFDAANWEITPMTKAELFNRGIVRPCSACFAEEA